MIGNTYLKLKLLKWKTPFKALYLSKGTRKVKDFQTTSTINKFTSPFNLIVLNNITNLSNSFHWLNFLEGRHILRQESFDGYIFSVWYKLIQFSLPLNPAIHRMGNAAKILCPSPDVENKKSLNPILYFIASSPKLL